MVHDMKELLNNSTEKAFIPLQWELAIPEFGHLRDLLVCDYDTGPGPHHQSRRA